jgi:hypothetical protein
MQFAKLGSALLALTLVPASEVPALVDYLALQAVLEGGTRTPEKRIMMAPRAGFQA